jgi:hypothetical protein
LAAERFGTRGAMAGDIANMVGLAVDGMEEQMTLMGVLDE